MPQLKSNKVMNFIPFSYAWLLFFSTVILWSCDWVLDLTRLSTPRGKEALPVTRQTPESAFSIQTGTAEFQLAKNPLATYTVGLKKSFVQVVSTECNSWLNFVPFSYEGLSFLQLCFRPMSPMKYSPMKWNMKARVDWISNQHERGIPLMKQLSPVNSLMVCNKVTSNQVTMNVSTPKQ
jgi:hypothetical protein